MLCIYVPKLCPGYLLKDFSEIMDHHTLEAASNQQQAGPQVSSVLHDPTPSARISLQTRHFHEKF